MNYRIIVVFAVVVLLSSGILLAQSNTLDDVHLFQNFFRDATIATNMYGEGGLQYSDYDAASSFNVGVQGGYPVNPKIEVGAGIGFISYSVEGGDSQSGISDLMASGRYNLLQDKTKISAGGFVTLPIGDEKINQGNLNFGAFGALRHPLSNGMVITGTLGLDFYETTKYKWEGIELKEETEYENALVLGGGVIYPTNEQLNIIGELTFKSKGDYMLLSGGVDYKLQMGSKVRGALGLGLDDGAPDLVIMGSFLHSF